MKIISKELMIRAAKMSSEWGTSGLIIINEEGELEVSVWQHYKFMDSKPEVVAFVDGIRGFEIIKEYKNDYKFEVNQKEII